MNSRNMNNNNYNNMNSNSYNNNNWNNNQNMNNNNWNMNNNNNWNNNNNNQMWRDGSRGMYGNNNYNNNNQYNNQYGNNQYGMYNNRGGQPYYGFNKFNIQWQNDYEGNHRYACANGQYMTSFKATKNHPKKKDRMFQVGCGGANAAQNCTWSEWMNDINADFFYQCPDNKVMTGMSSMANPNRNSNDNRNEFFTWWTRHASVINGVYSEYSPAVRDRRW